MKKYILSIILVFVLIIGYQVLKIYIPPQSNPDLLEAEPVELVNQPEHVHQYDLDIVLDTEKHTIGGKETIMLNNNSEDVWKEIYLRDYASAMYDDAQLSDFYAVTDGINTLDYQRDKTDPTIVLVRLKEELMPGETMRLVIDYQSYISQESSNRLNYREENTGVQLAEKYTLGQFYPVLAVYADGQWINHTFLEGHEPFFTELSNYHVSVTVPQDFTVCASGQITDITEDEEKALKTYHYEAQNIRDFAMSASNVYEMAYDTVDGITIYSYYFQGEEHFGLAALKTGMQGMQFFNRYLGKYPYDTLTIAAVPELPGGGMEYSGYVMILGDFYQNYQENDSTLSHKGPEKIVIHELAHQWFYGIIGNDQYDDAWLDESFASAMTLVFYDYFNDDVFKKETAGISSDSRKITRSAGELGDDYPCVYLDGEYFLLRIRGRMGEESFMKAMQEYVSSYAFQIAQPEDILKIFKNHSSRSLTSLYHKYIESKYY